MTPAFSSWRQAGGFTLLVLAMVALPGVFGRSGGVPRAAIYATMPESTGAFEYMRQQIFEEKSDLDIVFMGSSTLLAGVATSYVKHELGQKLGREARVITAGGFWSAEDRSYLILRDMLAHRKVGMLVLYLAEDEWSSNGEPYFLSYRFFQQGPDSGEIAGLSARWQAAYYAETALGAPRLLLASFLPPLPTPHPPHENELGAFRDVGSEQHGRPAWFSPAPPKLAPETMIYSAANRRDFHFSTNKLTGFQEYFLRKLGRLAGEHGVPLVILNIPFEYPIETLRRDRHFLHSSSAPPPQLSGLVEELAFWPDVLGTTVAMLGVPRDALFAGLSGPDAAKLFFNRMHFNTYGMSYFTTVITPALLQLYDQKAVPH